MPQGCSKKKGEQHLLSFTRFTAPLSFFRSFLRFPFPYGRDDLTSIFTNGCSTRSSSCRGSPPVFFLFYGASALTAACMLGDPLSDFTPSSRYSSIAPSLSSQSLLNPHTAFHVQVLSSISPLTGASIKLFGRDGLPIPSSLLSSRSSPTYSTQISMQSFPPPLALSSGRYSWSSTATDLGPC